MSPSGTGREDEDSLVLGWRVTSSLEPLYWLRPSAKPGRQSRKDLFLVPAENMATETVIIAQSGSGKSFFLGRLIEELILRTRSRCVILDPNADFGKIHQIEDESLWTKASYDRERRRGKLPDEASRREFEARWSRVPIRIKTRIDIGGQPYEPLELRWQALSMDLIAEELDPMLRSDLYHCHAFVQSLSFLGEYRHGSHGESDSKKSKEWIGQAEKLFRLARQLPEDDFRSLLEGEYASRNRRVPLKLPGIERQELSSAIQRLMTAPAYVSDAVARFYFGKAREYQAAGILKMEVRPAKPTAALQERLQVIDLPSLKDKRTRLVAVNALVAAEWEQARYAWREALERTSSVDARVPTFIIIDEAHNLIPAEPHNKAEEALVEQFRTIVAEGRKYGLFLILVSQRPDKLDPLVVSESDNKAVMRLGSRSILETTRRMLGLEDVSPDLLDKCLRFDVSRALLIGRWASDSPEIIYSAARRTIEGGRNLRPEHWAHPSGPDQERNLVEGVSAAAK